MIYNSDENPINRLPNNFKQYINNKVDVVSLFIVKKMNQLIPMLIVGFLIAFTLLFFTFFISYSFIQWYADYIGNASTASLIVSGFYLFVTLIIYFFRKSLIYKPIQKGIIKGLDFKDIHKSSSIRNVRTAEDIDNELDRLMQESEINDAEMGDNINEIKEFYTYEAIKVRFFTNILQNPKPVISTLLQGIMTFQSFRGNRKAKKNMNK